MVGWTRRPVVGLPALFAAMAMAMVITLVSAPSHCQAQQVSATGMSGNMDFMRLRRAIDALNKDMAALNREHQQLMACQNKGMAYAPASERADESGCLAPGRDCGSYRDGEIVSIAARSGMACAGNNMHHQVCQGPRHPVTSVQIKQCVNGKIIAIP